MQARIVALITLCFFICLADAQARPTSLFTHIAYSGSNNSPPPADSLAVYDSTLDVVGLAGMPSEVSVQIPRALGDVVATFKLDRMVRREGFAERDAWACSQGNAPACELIPYPGLPANKFSYTWFGEGNGYFLRLTVHLGNAVGVIWGPKGRFEIKWSQLKELRMAYFRSDEGFERRGDSLSLQDEQRPVPVLSAEETQSATLMRIEPQDPAGAGVAELDMLFLFTEEARRRAGGNPANCQDTTGIVGEVLDRIEQTNSAFTKSGIPARIGVATVTRLNGYTLIPYNGNPGNPSTNLINITLNANIRAYRNAVGADVVSAIFDTQTNLGPCGIANVQRRGCTYPDSTPGCTVGAQFSEWATYLDTIECTAVQIATH